MVTANGRESAAVALVTPGNSATSASRCQVASTAPATNPSNASASPAGMDSSALSVSTVYQSVGSADNLCSASQPAAVVAATARVATARRLENVAAA